MQRSPIYRHPWLYSAVMRALYVGSFQERYRVLAALIPEGSEVFEACAGDAYLYEKHLKHKAVRYSGGDLNTRFVAYAKQRGISLSLHDLTADVVPLADFVVLQASLYQFIPQEVAIVEKLQRAARRMLIVAEPVRNLSTSRSALVRAIARYSANPGDGHKAARFDESSLDTLFAGQFASDVVHSFLTPGGREKVYCLRGRA
ncbi:MAG: hypothetical protein RL701_6478 [Pseudomonadota bacterium]|jgi:hypothetical protein